MIWSFLKTTFTSFRNMRRSSCSDRPRARMQSQHCDATMARWTLRHLELAGFSLLLSIIVGIPIGIVASRGGAVGHVILGFVGIVQTMPSLALLALLVALPFFGI